jgi:hypothetical protein
VDPAPIAPDHEYEIVASESPVTVDGYALGEPKAIECEFCEAAMYLTREKTPGLWDLNHEPWCPNATDDTA